MKASRSAKLQQQLAAVEDEFRSSLAAVLPRVARSGESLFFNSQHVPHTFQQRWLPSEAESLFSLASECIELREQLTLPTAGSLAAAFLSACVEAAGNDPQRIGPRALASSLLSHIS